MLCYSRSSRTLCRLHDRAAGQLLLPQAGSGRVAFPEGLLAAADNDHGHVDDGQGGGARQHGSDAHQVQARPVPALLSRLRTGADGVDTQERRRPVRPRLLRHIIFETVFPGYPEVNNPNPEMGQTRVSPSAVPPPPFRPRPIYTPICACVYLNCIADVKSADQKCINTLKRKKL